MLRVQRVTDRASSFIDCWGRLWLAEHEWSWKRYREGVEVQESQPLFFPTLRGDLNE
jgi:hypothetical protein